ncbi:MAG TPA: hypothetical protein VGA70_10790 [Longimicrobiales bacterium]|jgi:hypothetical protein
MEPTHADDAALQEQANELYWGSDASVNQLAESLDLSKGALYNLVRPLPVGLPCPRCGTEMEYPNRTARHKGFITCPSCELEEEEEEVRLEWRAAAGGPDRDALVVDPGDHLEMTPDGGSAASRALIGTALLGAAAGVAVALWVRRRA